MKISFKDKDSIFDFQEVESDNGSCNLNGVWIICNKYRSTVNRPSKNQRIYAPESAATRISKAFLYSIYQIGK